MVRILKLLVVIALAAILIVGLTTTVCCNVTPDNPNGNTDGDTPNGNEPNGNEPNGDEPNGGELAEPDLINGPGVIIDCEEYGGSEFKQLDPAPVFSFQDANGSTFSLSDFQGKAVMLNFWTTRCGFCIVEMPFIQQVYDEWPDDDLVILTIDIGESADKVATFLQDNGISLPVLLDMEAEVAAQYRVNTIPRTLFIDEDGLIQAIRFGALQSKEELEDILNQLVNL